MIKKRSSHSKIVFKTAVYFLLNHDKHLVVYFLWFCPDGTTTALISEPRLIDRSEGLYAISLVPKNVRPRWPGMLFVWRSFRRDFPKGVVI